MRKINVYAALILLAAATTVQATPDTTQLAVWANEAIVATYSFNYKNFMQRQKEIAKYFTASGWTAYSSALIASQLPDTVKKNDYFVSSVALLPPEIKTIGPKQWQALMPLLVIYKNPQYTQKQTLAVTIHFSEAPSGQGVRGFAITSLQSKVTKPACECKPNEDGASSTTDDQSKLPDETQSTPAASQ